MTSNFINFMIYLNNIILCTYQKFEREIQSIFNLWFDTFIRSKWKRVFAIHDFCSPTVTKGLDRQARKREEAKKPASPYRPERMLSSTDALGDKMPSPRLLLNLLYQCHKRTTNS